MLITFIDVVSCENPHCRDFGHITPALQGVKSYYCPVCGAISRPRAADATLAADPQRYKEYLRSAISRESGQN